MKMIRCDVCKSTVNVFDSATIMITPNNMAQRFEINNMDSKTAITVEAFDLCKSCLVKTMRKYYGNQFGKGCDDK